MKVTLAPEQMVLSASLEVMLTLAGRLLLMLIVILFDVAVAGDAQDELDVNTHVIMSPLDNELFV